MSKTPMRTWTEQDLQQAQQRMGRGSVVGHATGTKSAPSTRRYPDGPKGRTGLTVAGAGSNPAPSPTKKFRSKLEEAWSNSLDMAKLAGEIVGYQYEPHNIRLPGKRNFYKPDFLVHEGSIANGGCYVKLTYYEVKGRNKSDDRSLVKMKTAAGITPWARFVLVKRQRGIWTEKVIT